MIVHKVRLQDARLSGLLNNTEAYDCKFPLDENSEHTLDLREVFGSFHIVFERIEYSVDFDRFGHALDLDFVCSPFFFYTCFIRSSLTRTSCIRKRGIIGSHSHIHKRPAEKKSNRVGQP